MTCAAQHPRQPEVRCQDPGGPGTHSPHYASPDWDWEDDDSRAWQAEVARRARMPRNARQRQMTGMAQDIRAANREDGSTPPRARTDDEWSAILAAEQIEPSADGRCFEVLTYLRARPNPWVNGLEFRTAEVGGASGDKRCRELRYHYGWDIRRRKPLRGHGVWEYLLVVPDS